MERIRLNRADGVFIAVCLVLLAAGLWVSFTYFQKAFPEAAIEFRYSRDQSGQLAVSVLDSLSMTPPADYRHASIFGFDNTAKTYLEKELGLKNAQPFFGDPIRLWAWRHRWFKPGTKEEFQVSISPSGELVRLDHLVEEEAPGADLPEEEARALAAAFLARTVHLDTSRLVFLESSREGRPHRADWTFTWKAEGVEPVEGSDYRYAVTILGDKVGGYREWLRVPEAWRADYKRLRSFNNLAGQVDGIGWVLTLIAVVAVFVIRMRRRDVHWRTAIAFGLVAAVLFYLNSLNSLPQTLYRYDTTTSWPGFLLQTLLLNLIASVGVGVLIGLLTASAETMYRGQYPRRLALPTLFSPRALRTKTAFKAIFLGITMTAFFIAYQIGIYLLADRLGAWSPADVPYDNLLNTAFPWIAVLLMGFFPAVSEEFLSRMFSIPFLQRAFRGRLTWLAVLIPAIIWGFGHAGYPNQPWWIRGAEVGGAGIIVGFIMLRYGILATLVWHYTVDALYTSLLLFRSDNPYFIATAAVGAGLLAIPLLVALFAYLRTGTFLPEKGLRNGDLAAPPPVEKLKEAGAEKEPEVPAALPLPAGARLLALGLLAVGAAAMLMPIERIGSFLAYTVEPKAAVRSFADSLRATGWANPDTMHLAAFVGESEENEIGGEVYPYLLKHVGSIREFNRIADSTLLIGRWKVNAWVPENRFRFVGTVSAATGEVQSLFPVLPEEMPGDSLSEDSARALIEALLQRQGVDLDRFEMKSHTASARPARMDHKFVYEALEGDPRHVGEAKFRRIGWVYGSYAAASKRPVFKIPESWQRDRRATTAARAAVRILRVLAVLAMVGGMIILLILLTRRGVVPWKQAFLLAIVPGVLALTGLPGRMHLFTQSYFQQVEIPWSVFKGTMLTSMLISVVFQYLLAAVIFALLGGMYPKAARQLRLGARRLGATDGWLALLAGVGGLLLLRTTKDALAAASPGWVPWTGWGVPGWFASPWPFGSMLASGVEASVIAAGLLAFVAYLWTGPLRRTGWRILVAAVLLIAFLPDATLEGGEWVFSLLHAAAFWLLVWLVLRVIVAGRPVNLVALALAAGCLPPVLEAVGSGNGSISMEGWLFALLVAFALAVWMGLPGRARR